MGYTVFLRMGLAVLVFFLVACGGAPDEDVPELKVDADSRTADALLTITGTVGTGADLSVQVGQVSFDPTMTGVNEEGEATWSADIILLEGSNLAGINILTVTAIDRTGNNRAIVRTIVLDVLPPALPPRLSLDETLTKLAMTFNEQVAVDTLVISGVRQGAEGEGEIIFGTLSAVTEGDFSTSFIWEAESPLASGIYQVSMQAGLADDLGNATVNTEIWTFSVASPAN